MLKSAGAGSARCVLSQINPGKVVVNWLKMRNLQEKKTKKLSHVYRVK